MLAYEDMEKFENVVIHAGVNNIVPNDEVDTASYEKQLKYEFNQLKKSLEGFQGDLKILMVAESELATSTSQAKKMLEKINDQIKKFADDNNGTVIAVDDSLEDDVCGWDDYRHYSEVLCAKVLQSIDDTYPEDGQKFLRVLVIPLHLRSRTRRFSVPTSLDAADAQSLVMLKAPARTKLV